MLQLKDIGAASSGFGIWTGSALKNLEVPKNDFNVDEFLDYTIQCGLGGVELPPLRFFKDYKKEILDLIKRTDSLKSFLLFDCDQANFSEQVKTLAPYVAQTKTKILRIKTSDVLGCERHKVATNWQEHVVELTSRLEALKPVLSAHNIKIAIENHQDLDSDDFVFILEKLDSDLFGINWDIGNSFATLESPIDFAKKFQHKIINAHIKDYAIVKRESGFGLVRCVIGSGNVNFREVFNYLESKSPACSYAVELGAHHTRWINYKEENFFSFFKNRKLKDCQIFIDSYLSLETNKSSCSNILEQLVNKNISIKQAVEAEKKEFEESIKYLAGKI